MQTVYKVVRSNPHAQVGEWNTAPFISHHGVARERADYSLGYRLNVRTIAPRGTLGIFVFTKLEDARHFASNYNSPTRPSVILEAEGFGRPLKVDHILSFAWRDLWRNKHYRRRALLERFDSLRTEERDNYWMFFLPPPGSYTVSSIIPRRVVA